MTLELRLQLCTRQELSQSLVISCAHLMSLPDEVMAFVAREIQHNPEGVERTLKQNLSTGTRTEDYSGNIRSIYGYTVAHAEGSVKKLQQEGFISEPDLESITGGLPNATLAITPDVTYIGRENNKPEVVFSDHLKGAMSLNMLQVDATKYPQTARLIASIKRFDEWKREKLREAYIIIGNTQRDYFVAFDPSVAQCMDQSMLGYDLGVTNSTVSRLFVNRWVEARNCEGQQKFLEAKRLLLTRDNQKKALFVPLLNEILEEEFLRNGAYSDETIVDKLHHRLARRTITKYRDEAGIPIYTIRAKQYNLQQRENPYTFRSPL